jgi:TetR/AcrR family transcriptional repressor of nem operon
MNTKARQDTRALLLEEAEKLIRTRGYAGFSYANLSALVGITKASIHHHFPTKDELVQTTLENYRLRYRQDMESIETHHHSAMEMIAAYGALYLNGLDKGLGCLCAILATEKDLLPANIQQATNDFFEDHLNWLTKICADGQDKGAISQKLQPRACAHLILTSLEGALITARLASSEPTFKNAIQILMDSLKPE